MTERDHRLIDLAVAVSDGAPIDWEAAESAAASDSERRQIAHLRRVRALVNSQGSSAGDVAGIEPYESLLHPPSAEAVSHSEPTPVTWGSLVVVEKIGHGQFGDVYRARDPRLDREVALKLMRHRSAEDLELGSIVVDEGRLLAKVRHPNVVTVLGAERIDGRVGVWMELIRGRTLEEELSARGPFPEPEIVRIGVDLGRALEAVHRAGLVHRDVKAQNVMCDADGRLVLMDFGTGRELKADTVPELAGTPLYLSPEVLEGASATPRSDVYSLGVLLFHLASGDFPVNGKTFKDIQAAHRHGASTGASVRLPVGSRLRAAVARAMEADPARRFATAGELASALAETTSSDVGATTSRRRLLTRPLVVAVAFAAVAIAAALAPRALSHAKTTTGIETERVLWADGNTPWSQEEASISPNGRFIAYVDRASGNLRLRNLQGGTDRPLTDKSAADTGVGAEEPLFSRDGTQIVYDWGVMDGKDDYWELRVLDAREPAIPSWRVLYDYRGVNGSPGVGWIGAEDWSPDGTRIAVQMRVADGSSRIGWLSTIDKSMHILAAADWRMSRQLAWSPDGEYLAYDAAPDQSGDPDVFLARADGTSVRAIRAAPGADSVVGWLEGRLMFLSESRDSRTVWAQAIAAGAPVGAPVQVLKDLLGEPFGPSTTGALNLSIVNDPHALYETSVDFTTGRPTSPVSTAIADALPQSRLPKWSPDGRLFAYVSNARKRELSYRILSIVAPGWDEPRVLPLKLAQLWTYDFSPNGRSILARAQSLQGESGIFLIDAQTGAVTRLLGWTEEVRQFLPHWSADGGSFYYTKAHNNYSDFVLRNLASGRERVLFSNADLRLSDGSLMPPVRDLTVSPDFRLVACQTVEADSALWVISLKDRAVREVYRVSRANAFLSSALAWTPDSRGLVINQATTARIDQPRELWYVPLSGAPLKLDVGRADIRAEPAAVDPHAPRVAFVAGDRPTVKIVRRQLPRPGER